MILKRISILNYKNLEEVELAFSPKLNSFFGQNGMGKTNLLDAIYFLSFCKSAGNPIDSQNIRHDADFFVIQGFYEGSDGTPEEIYARPYNAFVSTFIGHSNLFYGTIKKGADVSIVFSGGYEIPMKNLSDSVQDGQKVVVSIRPEEFAPSDTGFHCTVADSTFLGKYTNYFLDFPAGICVENQPSIEFSQDLGHAEHVFRSGDALCLKPNAAKINVFTENMERSLIKGAERFGQD